MATDDYDKSYNITLMVVGFVVPTVIVLYTNVAVMRKSKKVNI